MCYCASQDLYSEENEAQYILVEGQSDPILAKRDLSTIYHADKSPYCEKFLNTIEAASITLPYEISSLDYNEIIEDPLDFYKKFISKNVPCIIKNGINDWEALDKWNDTNYLAETLADTKLTVDISPDGYKDSIKSKYFVQPYQETMNMKNFLGLKDNDNMISYIQKQNNNLNEEFIPLIKDCNTEFQEFFRKNFFTLQPDASNFWMGESDSVSSMHKDHYENIYAVIKGEKHFTLIPPVCYPFLYEGEFINSRWNKIDDKFYLKPNDLQDKVSWITSNIDSERDMEMFPMLDSVRKYHVVLEAGDVLYLPALWYHQVTQYSKNSDYIIAVNYWFDMEHDYKYVLFDMIQNLVKNP